MGVFLFGAPKPKVSCLAENRQVTMSLRQPDGSYKEHDEDDWYVNCEITLNGKTIVAPRSLPLAHPTSFRDAMLAIEDWRTKEAPKILKELKSKEKK